MLTTLKKLFKRKQKIRYALINVYIDGVMGNLFRIGETKFIQVDREITKDMTEECYEKYFYWCGNPSFKGLPKEHKRCEIEVLTYFDKDFNIMEDE